MSIVFVGEDVARYVREVIEEARQSVPDHENWGPTSPRDEAICRAQSDLHRRGFREAHLVHSAFGWSVRYGSGLDNFELLASSRWGTVDGSAKSALVWGRQWQAAVPQCRYLTFRGDRLPVDLELAARELGMNVFPQIRPLSNVRQVR